MIGESELIINPKGCIYHLDVHPDEIAHTIITVGDPGACRKYPNTSTKLNIESTPGIHNTYRLYRQQADQRSKQWYRPRQYRYHAQ